MMRTWVLITVLAVVSPSAAFADYRSLIHEIDSYQPPPRSQDRSVEGAPDKDSAGDDAFLAEKKRIEAMKSAWEQSLSVSNDAALFYRVDVDRLNALGNAGSDASMAARVLENRFTLEQAEILALIRNPGVTAAENRLRAALEAFTQVAALDEILRQYAAFTQGLMPGVGPMKGNDPVAMKFPFPGVLSLKGQIVNDAVRIERETLEAVRRDTVTAIRMAFWNLAHTIRAQRITAEMVELITYLESVADTRYRAGKTSYQDVIKVRISLEILKEDLTTLGEGRKNLEAKIREILHLPESVKPGTPEGDPGRRRLPDLEALYAIAVEKRQELRRLRAKIAKMERMLEMAETMIYPGYSSNFSLYTSGIVTTTGPGAPTEPFGVNVEAYRGAGLPKAPGYGTEDAYLRETRQNLAALREELENTRAQTLTRVRDAWFDWDRSRREAALYGEKVVRLSRSALDVSTRGYEAGSVTFADVIDTYRQWLTANLALSRSRSDLQIAWARVEQAVGASIRGTS